MQSLTFKFNKPLSILVVLILPVLLKLGFWQMDRAEEKKQIIAEIAEVKQQGIASWQPQGLKSGQLVKISGHFTDKEYWLLDNRINRGRVGFEVVMPFVSGTEIILVNRGWVKGDPSRRELPAIKTPAGKILLTGRVHRAIQNNLVEYMSTGDWPKVISAVEPLEMYQEINQNAVDSVVRLQGDSQAALVTDWPVVNVRPEKHTAYAVQWFAMAFALFMMYAVYSSNVVAMIFSNYDDNNIRKKS